MLEHVCVYSLHRAASGGDMVQDADASTLYLSLPLPLPLCRLLPGAGLELARSQAKAPLGPALGPEATGG